MTGTDEEEPAPVWPDELRHERTIGKYFAIAFCIVMAFIVVLMVDASRHPSPRPYYEPSYTESSSFQNVFYVLGCLAGAGLLVACLFTAHRAMKLPEDAVEQVRLLNRARLCAVLGVALVGAPLWQDVYGIYGLELAKDFCWYFAATAFLVGDINLRDALRLKQDPAAKAPAAYSAGCFVIGFLMMAAPAVMGFLAEGLR